MNTRKIITYTLATLSGVSFGLALSFYLLQNGFFNSSYRAFVVQSGSMEPAINTGSMVFGKSSENYQVGDVINFSVKKGQVVTHRINSIHYDGGVAQYKTKGDANEEPDSFVVARDQIIGKVGFSVPYIGYLSSFVRTPRGFVALVIIPASIIVYEEIKKVLQEVKKLIAKNNNQQTNNTNLKQKLPVLIPILGVFLLFAGASISYFHDSEDSPGNVLSASSDFGARPSKTLVINEIVPDSSCFQGQTEAQWIEVYNKFDTDINLKDFKISDGVHVINIVNAGNIIIPPNGFALLAHSQSIWNHCYDDNDVITANLGSQINIDSGFLQLLDKGDTILDTVIWDNLDQDKSLEREPAWFDTKFGAEFEATDFVERDIPTPGS